MLESIELSQHRLIEMLDSVELSQHRMLEMLECLELCARDARIHRTVAKYARNDVSPHPPPRMVYYGSPGAPSCARLCPVPRGHPNLIQVYSSRAGVQDDARWQLKSLKLIPLPQDAPETLLERACCFLVAFAAFTLPLDVLFLNR